MPARVNGKRRAVQIVYDAECPVCDLYCRSVSVKPHEPPLEHMDMEPMDVELMDVELVDARKPGELMREITVAGFDIDEGMAVKHDGMLYYGPDAIHKLAELSDRQGLFNRLSRIGFGSPARARRLYPIAKACRNLLLKALRKTRINNLNLENRERF